MANFDLDYEGSEVQDILDTGKSLEDDGYIFLGTATPSTIPGTPIERVAYVGGPGTYNNFGTTVVVPSGSIVVITYSGSAWSKTVINASLPVSTTLGSDNTTIPTSKAVKDVTDAINTKLGEGYVYAGIATATTNPGTPTGKVFYLAKDAGTYTNFGGLTLTEGVNILKYNGTAWSQEQLISIADIYKNPLIGYYECDTAGGTAAKTVAATGYVLPTTGGSVKIKMANRNTVANATLNINSTGAKPLFYNGVRAGVGNTWDTNEIVEVFYDGTNYQAYNVAGSNGDGVFDISAYNLTDGQPTPYVDLAAALGTDGEHVPQSLRKGGMSVKFIQGSVQSSDNKYVQYRLMSDSFNTTVANWQGVDDVPTAGSNNLVKSGGVAAKKDSFPFATNLGLPILTSFKDFKIYGYEAKDVQYIQLLYFFNSRPVDNKNVITITIKALDGTSKNIDASLGSSIWNQQHGIHQYNFIDGTTTIGYVVVDWDIAPASEFYGNTTNKFVVLSSACFVNKKVTIDSVPTAESGNAVSSGGTYAAINTVKDGITNNVSPFTTVAEPLINVIPKLEISVGKIEHFAYKYILNRFYNIEGYRNGQITRIAPDGTTEIANFNVVDGQVSNILYFGGLTDANHTSWLDIYIDLDQFAVTSWDGTMYIRSENIHMKYDSSPTTDSENLVTSGGVKSYVDGKENSNSVFFKTDGYNYTGDSSNMPLMVKSLEITDEDYFDGYIWPQYIFNYAPTTTPPRSYFALNHTTEDGQTTTNIIVEGADNGGYDINHQGIITHNLLVGEVVIGKIVIDWDLYKGLEFYGNQTNRLLKVKRSCYKIVGSQGITKANDYSVKDDTKHIIKVDVLGNGDYTTIKAACLSIDDSAYDNQYEIVVFPGIYYENDIHVPAYTHIHGLAPNTVVVSSKQQEGQTTLPVFDQEYASSKLSNMRIDSHTGYCIHFDRALNGCSIKNENLYLFRDSQVSGDITGGGSFKDGTLYEWIGCTFDGRATNYGGTAACHTNVNANYENLHLVYRNCKFINSAPRVGSVGGFGHCVLEVENCVFVDSILGCWIADNLRSLDEPWSYIVPNYEWQVLGGNNKGMAVYATSTAEALQVIADTRVEGQTIKLGGSALADIFGPIIRYSKGGNLVFNANAIGIYRVKDEQAGTPGYSEQRDVYQLWKRLGNCSVTNKTLTVQIDDGAVQTYTFNKDYLTTKDSETDILAAINAVLTGCTIQKYVSGQVDGWQNVNLIEKIQITAATDIRFGRWITKDGGIATSSTPAEDILGIAVSNTPKGEYADVWTGNSWFSWGILEIGANYGSSDYGEIVKNATITLAVAKTQSILERL